MRQEQHSNALVPRRKIGILLLALALVGLAALGPARAASANPNQCRAGLTTEQEGSQAIQSAGPCWSEADGVLSAISKCQPNTYWWQHRVLILCFDPFGSTGYHELKGPWVGGLSVSHVSCPINTLRHGHRVEQGPQ